MQQSQGFRESTIEIVESRHRGMWKAAKHPRQFECTTSDKVPLVVTEAHISHPAMRQLSQALERGLAVHQRCNSPNRQIAKVFDS